MHRYQPSSHLELKAFCLSQALDLSACILVLSCCFPWLLNCPEDDPRVTKSMLQEQRFYPGKALWEYGLLPIPTPASVLGSNVFGIGWATGNASKSSTCVQVTFSKDLPWSFRLSHPFPTPGSELIECSHRVKLQDTHLVWQLQAFPLLSLSLLLFNYLASSLFCFQEHLATGSCNQPPAGRIWGGDCSRDDLLLHSCKF